jgi:predicted phosphate transport protein (TIGR00153 family)
LVKLSELLHEAINVPKEERDSYYQKMDQLELSIEEITHKTNLELSKNFITPFDREDIHSLITSIDEVSDNINGAASRMRLYQVEEITKSIRKLTEINLDACKHISLAVNELKEMKNLKNILAAVKSIIKLERKSDTVFSKAVAELFEHTHIGKCSSKTFVIYSQ